MTRETRVGLLLGLAIIIAIGMILSEVTQPEAVDDQSQPIAINSNYYQQKDIPLEDITSREPAGRDERPVFVAGIYDDEKSSQSIPVQIKMRRPAPIDNLHSRPLASGNILRQDEGVFTQPRIVPSQHRVIVEEPKPIKTQEQFPEYGLSQPLTPDIAKQPSRTKPYTVKPGDSLYKIASKVYGSGKGQFYKKIYEANRDKMSDPSMVIVGQKLVIPLLPGQIGSNKETRISLRDQRALDELRRELDNRSSASRNNQRPKRSVYVVRRGDNLTRIARKMLNDTSDKAVQKIYEANRDKLPDPDSIFEGMKLQIPS